MDNQSTSSYKSTGVATLRDELEQANTLWGQFQRAKQLGRQAAQPSTNTGPQLRSHWRYEHRHSYLTAILDSFEPDACNNLFCLTSAQMTANKGVKVFGEAGDKVIEKELMQLLTRSVMHGVHGKQLTRKQRCAALRNLMFLKEKRCGTIKGRGCTDGRKPETSSPTLSNKAIFLSCLIDAAESRHALVCDIPGAFMQEHIDKLLHVKLDGAILEVLL